MRLPNVMPVSRYPLVRLRLRLLVPVGLAPARQHKAPAPLAPPSSWLYPQSRTKVRRLRPTRASFLTVRACLTVCLLLASFMVATPATAPTQRGLGSGEPKYACKVRCM